MRWIRNISTCRYHSNIGYIYVHACMYIYTQWEGQLDDVATELGLASVYNIHDVH